jgi:hypothetical protein
MRAADFQWMGSFIRTFERAKLSKSDFWVFRDEREPVGGAQLVDDVRRLVRRALHSGGDSDALTNAVIGAGSLECGLADANAPCAHSAADLTDALAFNLLQRDEVSLRQILRRMDHLDVPELLVISRPEGFSYYALHPYDLAVVADSLPQSPGYAVVGIRSVGTTLSAMITAKLRRAGQQAQRITVRPSGHPYERTLQFTPEQAGWVQSHHLKHSLFVVVDEGPGRSGSTFLSVAEALRKAGISSAMIVLVGSHCPKVASLCAPKIEERWREFNFLAAERWACGAYQNLQYLGGGEWRSFLFSGSERDWPACWPQMERLKFFSKDGAHIIKFEGLGTQGESARGRAECLADAGFGAQFDETENGFVHYRRIAGGQLRKHEITRADVERLADYCVFRRREFPAPKTNPTMFTNMINFNLSLEFGEQINFSDEVFNCPAPVISDSRMRPHEWIRDASGRLIKTDGVSHGDDHFFPGPVDIAWDLAGSAIEWNLSATAEEHLLHRFQRQSGHEAGARMPEYKIAYASFQLACCKMALPTTQGTRDEEKLLAEIIRYNNCLKLLLADVTGGRIKIRQAA